MAKNNNPWIKIFFRDWLESERVIKMSCAAEGIYMRCLLLQSVRSNLPQNLNELVLLLQKPYDEVSKVWHEVEPHFETELVDGETRIYNAKHREQLEADAAKSKNYSRANKKKAKSKFDPNLPQTSSKLGTSLNQNRALRASVSDSVSVSASVSSKTGDSKGKKDHLGNGDPRFCEFYDSYPRKISRKDAYAAYRKLVKTDADHAKLVQGTRIAASGEWAGRPKDKIPHPSTWINSLNWQDDTADLSAPEPQRDHGKATDAGFTYPALGGDWYDGWTGEKPHDA